MSDESLNKLDYFSHLEDAVVQLLQVRERHDTYMASITLDTSEDIEAVTRYTLMFVRADALCLARLRVLVEGRPGSLPFRGRL